eukprot:XP_011663926.1 PREDICTED: calcium-activated chloride channel regulator 1-like [Strongylocentrotus purpuratus]
MFTSASERLYLASKQHVYWKHIKILVPNTWSIQSGYQFARTETLESANIIVHNFPDDEPFVDNYAGCGKEGKWMHMTPDYILSETYREDKFGSTDNVLVRSWSYLRWGLFKEHYDGKGVGAPAYDSPGVGTEGTRCSLKINGGVKNAKGTPCQSNPNGGYDSDCRFIPDNKEQTATASLLFGTNYAHIHSIKEFCSDDQSDPNNLHNPEAPNLMNIKCSGDSAWKVMTERTTDFTAGIQPVSNTTPTFDVIQLSTIRSVVLVLDISGSMSGNRFDRMIQSSTDYIMNVIPDGSKLGIVVFDTASEIRANLIDVTDKASRQSLVNALPPSTKSSTCIGCGILSGIQVLGSYAQGGYIVLLSDGGENVSPLIGDTYAEIESSGVIIDTITISNSADQQLEDLSTMTSGISTFCSDIGTGTCLIQAFQSTITERPGVGVGTVPIQIYSSEIVIERYPGLEVVPVIIDAALGNETVITVIWTTSSSISVVVTGPDGTRIDEYDQRYNIDTNTKIVTINLPLAQPGRWNVTIHNTQVAIENASVAVTSKPSTEEYKPVTVTVLLGSREVDFSQTPALAIYTQVQQDYQPVLNADVTAIISDASSSTTTMILLDNGSGSDLFKDDGTYSGFFLNFASDGRYNVKVNVLGYDDVIEVAENGRSKRSVPVEMDTVVEPSFMRTASGGVFKVQSYTPNAPDTLPPSRIQDLVYTSFSYDNSTVTLSWTAVGDDMDQGTAYSYELRYSTNFSEVRDNFNESTRVTQDQLVYGNLSHINPPGVIESVTITLPEKGEDIVYYFAIRAWDEAGNGGQLSNIASLSIRFIPLAVTTTIDPTMLATDAVTELITNPETTEAKEPTPSERSETTLQQNPETTETEEPTGQEDQALIIGLSCALGAVSIVAGVSLMYIYYLKHSLTQVKPTTPPESAWTQQDLPDTEMVQNPAYDNPTLSTS